MSNTLERLQDARASLMRIYEIARNDMTSGTESQEICFLCGRIFADVTLAAELLRANQYG